MLLTSKKKCVGCAVCSYVCPKKCIVMKKNREHFIEPQIKKTECVNCDLCNKCCPVYEKKIEKDKPECYIAQLKDKEKLKECASGGAFLGIAEHIIELGGKVFGVAYDENKLKYKMIETKKELISILNSKYFQCELSSDIYRKIDECSKHSVVFVSGTPCMISAIKNIPNLNIQNVIFLEILCQGVPNDFVVNKYNEEKERVFGKKINNHIFRSKDKYVGRNYLNKYIFDDGTIRYYIGEEDALSLSFQRQIFLRNSCYSCNYSGKERVADFTVGDYWNIDYCNKNIDLKDGISVILCNTERAKLLMEKIDKFNLVKIDANKALYDNVPYNGSVKKPLVRKISFIMLNIGVKPSYISKILCIKYYLKKLIRRNK